MKKVTLRRVTRENFQECISLKVKESQKDFVAPNLYSVAQAYTNPLLSPWVAYDNKILGREPNKDEPIVGFVMWQRMDGVGFIMRLMVGERFQGQGYGKAILAETVRRLKKHADTERIATSFAKGNEAVENLYRSAGFVDLGLEDEREIYLKLDWDPK